MPADYYDYKKYARKQLYKYGILVLTLAQIIFGDMCHNGCHCLRAEGSMAVLIGQHGHRFFKAKTVAPIKLNIVQLICLNIIELKCLK